MAPQAFNFFAGGGVLKIKKWYIYCVKITCFVILGEFIEHFTILLIMLEYFYFYNRIIFEKILSGINNGERARLEITRAILSFGTTVFVQLELPLSYSTIEQIVYQRNLHSLFRSFYFLS